MNTQETLQTEQDDTTSDQPAGGFLQPVTGSDHPKLQRHLLNQSLEGLWRDPEISEEKWLEKMAATMAALAAMAPQDEMEGMLAVQMFAAHNAAMECFRRAMAPDQSSETRDRNLKNANKLLSTYVKQMEALDKRRRKAQQTIEVKHLHVHDGGQAIVGNVETTSKEATKHTQPAALEHSADPVMPPLIEQDAPEKSAVEQKVSERGG